MFCNNCGRKMDQEVRFCSFCGKEMSSTPKEPIQEATFQQQTPGRPIQLPADGIPKPAPRNTKVRYALFAVCGMVIGAILLAVILFSTGVFSSDVKAKDDSNIKMVEDSDAKTAEGPGFSTPEDAAKAYLTGLHDQDIDAMTAAFAIESYVDNYNFEASVERMQAYVMNTDIFLPNTNDYTRMLNVASRSNKITTYIIMQYMLFNAPEELNGGSTVTFSEEDTLTVQDFVAKFEQDTDNYVFEDLVITGTMPPEELTEVYLNEKNLQNIAKQAKVFGVAADDVVNVVITFEADGQTWVFCPQAVRYDNKWYLQSSAGNLASLLGMSVYTGSIAPFASGELQLTQFGN